MMARVSASVYGVFLVALSFLPLRYKQRLHTRGPLHNVAHLVAFGLLAFLMMRSGRSRLQAYVLAATARLLAFGIEVAQRLVIGTPMEWTNTRLDTAAVLIAMFVFSLESTILDRLPREDLRSGRG